LPDDGGNLASFITALEQTLEQLNQWVQTFQGTAADMLTRLVREAPGQLPDGADLPDMLAQIAALPDRLRTILEAVRAKLRAPIAAGSLDERHHAYTDSNPGLAHEAVDIAATDQVVAGGTVQQATAAQATAAAAAAVSRDLRPEEASLEAHQAGDTLVASAHDLPSTRAGMELLIAGVGTGLHRQADLQAATADRLTLLVQQTAQVSQQLSALAATSAAATLRLAEQDRAALDAQLGFADAVSAAAGTLQDLLSGVGDSTAAEPQLSSLY
jgi:methyl-accepting chemotaxis protein